MYRTAWHGATRAAAPTHSVPQLAPRHARAAMPSSPAVRQRCPRNTEEGADQAGGGAVVRPRRRRNGSPPTRRPTNQSARANRKKGAMPETGARSPRSWLASQPQRLVGFSRAELALM